MSDTYSVLFIGNSYTYYNDMPALLFKPLAQSLGFNVEVTAITKGGYKLSQHADPNDECGRMVEAALTGDKVYDYVILQEQSIRPASDEAPEFYDAVRNLADRIRRAGAEPVLYSTWGRKTGSAMLYERGWTNKSMTADLAKAYRRIGEELEIPVAYVGLAFYDVYTNHGEIELYDPDMSHPSLAGSFLAAATLVSKIFNADPMTADLKGELSHEDKKALCLAAKKTVFEL